MPKNSTVSIFHRFSHWFGWFHSTTEVWTESSSRGEVWMVGYRCEECGEIYGVHETLTGARRGGK